jgi:hypothetical protein
MCAKKTIQVKENLPVNKNLTPAIPSKHMRMNKLGSNQPA